MGRAKKPPRPAHAAARSEGAPAAEPEPQPDEAAEPEGSAEAPAAAPSAAPQPVAAEAAPPPKRGSLGKVMTENTQFLSSVVIGGAGLIATSIYQYNNSKLAQRQAEWQQQREEEKSSNEWRIERAKILAQNLQTLTARGPDTAEQRYGVLLSLTRGKIIERDLAVSYALELGKDSHEDMRSVLANIEDKDIHYYRRLAEAYEPTCVQRYGITVPGMYVCRKDRLEDFSKGIAESVADDLDTQTEVESAVPMALLRDERYVHSRILHLLGLYNEFIDDVCERRQWNLLDHFLGSSAGARLVGTLDLLMQSLDASSGADQSALHTRIEEGQAWLKTYLYGATCDGECRSRMTSVLVSNLGRSPEHFPLLLRSLLEGQRGEVMPFVARLQGRLTYCQVDPGQIETLRDRVLIPALLTQVGKATPDQSLIDDLVALLQPLPLPPDSSADWKKLQAALTQVTKGRQPKLLFDRRLDEQKRRKAQELAAKAAKAAEAATTNHNHPKPNGATANGATASGAAAAGPPLIAGSNFCNFVGQSLTQTDSSDE